MKKIVSLAVATLLMFLVFAISGCGSSATDETGQQAQQGEQKTGTLQFTANGEDFVRQGFVSKDGWAINFDHVYVNLSDVTAYQSEPPYDAHVGGEVIAQNKVSLPGIHTVDLAQGDENAAPILVGKAGDAVAGHYNAVSWKMTRAAEGPAKGYSLVVTGTAEKEGQTVSFTIKDEQEYHYTGGDYVGDERKGVLQEGGTADVEMTFHFDHIFGDADTPLEDELNTGAPGFEPFASLAQEGRVDVDMAALESMLAPADLEKLQDMLPTLGHVGEGHCHVEKF
ncbi:hypothetical protein [Desulfoscipio gibsoniae]|uniref:DUF4382 domain-containing protein n=1 Tax=Desulfoscipio gibsoniae DSM 7213 TaxID=767817 RepID=R4KF41_9FIRM|nr:hypothetical protein [Desulfoscipio gibsoniae]AGL00287.1 hypothetical protein Desgi_0732 [Desulfoscipio gibsoniae DSM 7213]